MGRFESFAKKSLRNCLAFHQFLSSTVQVIKLSRRVNCPDLGGRKGSYSIQLIRDRAVETVSLTRIGVGDNIPTKTIPGFNHAVFIQNVIASYRSETLKFRQLASRVSHVGMIYDLQKEVTWRSFWISLPYDVPK